MNLRKIIMSRTALISGFWSGWACLTLTIITDMGHRDLTRGLLGASTFILVSLCMFALHSAAFRAHNLPATGARSKRPVGKRIIGLWLKSLLVSFGLCVVFVVVLLIFHVRNTDIIELCGILAIDGIVLFLGIQFTKLYDSGLQNRDLVENAASLDSVRRWSIGAVYLVFLPIYLLMLVGSLAFFGALYLSIRLGTPIYLLPLLVCSAGCFALAYRATGNVLVKFDLKTTI
jgi:hypothetical protein